MVDVKLTRLENITLLKGENILEYPNCVTKLINEHVGAGHSVLRDTQKPSFCWLPANYDVTTEYKLERTTVLKML